MTKNYVKGSAREKTFDNGSSLVNFSININDIGQYADEKGWVQFTMSERRETDGYGNTHTIYINEFKPKPKEEETASDVPF